MHDRKFTSWHATLAIRSFCFARVRRNPYRMSALKRLLILLRHRHKNRIKTVCTINFDSASAARTGLYLCYVCSIIIAPQGPPCLPSPPSGETNDRAHVIQICGSCTQPAHKTPPTHPNDIHRQRQFNSESTFAGRGQKVENEIDRDRDTESERKDRQFA